MLGIKNHRVAPSVDSHQDVDNESCTSPSTRSTRAPKVPAARRPCDVSLQDMSTGTARPVSEWAQLLSGSSAIYSSKIASMLQRKRGRLTFRSASLEAVYGRYYLGFWKRQATLVGALQTLTILTTNVAFMFSLGFLFPAVLVVGVLTGLYLVGYAFFLWVMLSSKTSVKAFYRILPIQHLLFLAAGWWYHGISPFFWAADYEPPFSLNCTAVDDVNNDILSPILVWKLGIYMAYTLLMMPGIPEVKLIASTVAWCVSFALIISAIWFRGAQVAGWTAVIFGLVAVVSVLFYLHARHQDKYSRRTFALWALENKRRLSLSEEKDRQFQSENDRRRLFLASVAHDIRTPVHAIQGVLDLLYSDESLNMSQRDDLLLLKTSSETLMRLVNDFLDFAKGEAGALQLEPAPFNIGKVTEDQVLALCPKIHNKNIDVLCFVDPASVPPVVIGDAGRFCQVLNNLISNAYKFSPPESVLRVVLEQVWPARDTFDREEIVIETISRDTEQSQALLPRSPQHPQRPVKRRKKEADQENEESGDEDMSSEAGIWLGKLTVRDEGPGIPPEELPRLFEKFYQSTAKSKDVKSTGLGLTISKQLCEAMGGSIEVHSTLGYGSEFCAYFSFKEGRPETESRSSTGRKVSGDVSPLPASRDSHALSKASSPSLLRPSSKTGSVGSYDAELLCVLSGVSQIRDGCQATLAYGERCLQDCEFVQYQNRLSDVLSDGFDIGKQLYYKIQASCTSVDEWIPVVYAMDKDGIIRMDTTLNDGTGLLRTGPMHSLSALSQSLGQLPHPGTANDIVKSFTDPSSAGKFSASFRQTSSQLPPISRIAHMSLSPSWMKQQNAVRHGRAGRSLGSDVRGSKPDAQEASLAVLPLVAEDESMKGFGAQQRDTQAAVHEIIFVDVPPVRQDVETWCLEQGRMITARAKSAVRQSSYPAAHKYRLSVVFVYPIGVIRRDVADRILDRVQGWIDSAAETYLTMNDRMRSQLGLVGQKQTAVESRQLEECSGRDASDWFRIIVKMMAKPVRRETVRSGIIECLRGSIVSTLLKSEADDIEREGADSGSVAKTPIQTKILMDLEAGSDPLWHSTERSVARHRRRTMSGGDRAVTESYEQSIRATGAPSVADSMAEGASPAVAKRSVGKGRQLSFSSFEVIHAFIVDDEQMNINLLQRMLKRLGVKSMEAASDGQEALKLLTTSRFGVGATRDPLASQTFTPVLLIDQQIPGMSGTSVVEEARKAGFTAPCILVTSAITDSERDSALRRGVNDIVLKPFTLEDLRRLLMRWCAG